MTASSPSLVTRRDGDRRRKPAGAPQEVRLLDTDPQWYKDAVIYQVHVRAFADGNDDGAGDFRGLTERLDYLQDLGVTAVWLLPFYPSPLRDDGYDIADYTTVNPSYGTLQDFKTFLREAHRRGLRVITELVLNHTSDQHPWFQRARRAKPGSRWRDYYVWSDTDDRYREARIIFKDFETSNWTWDPVAQAYFWHRFYSHQPDLNYDNPEVRQAMLQVVDHWLGMGVDGLRLDAVPYLFEREGTNCENLPETHAALKDLRAHVDATFPGRMLLAEANQWPDDAVAYFGNGDECHTAFHFPVMPRLFMAVQMEDRFPVIDILQQTPPIPDICQWVLFLRNHDELTLEMVTDEERDYMYRMYARNPQARINLGIRRRLGPLLGNHRRKIELMNALLMSLPGTPVIYYGDEIGMGDNIYVGDRNGVRTPMQWSPDRNAGFSRANPQQLYLPVVVDYEYHYESVNVETQRQNPYSMFWWMKRLMALRQQHRIFGRGSLEFLLPENSKVLAFIRRLENESILIVANLSRFAQFVELDLSAYRGSTPVELFGRTQFPRIGELPYLLTLGPHSFYWFALETPSELAPQAMMAPAPAAEPELPSLHVTGSWERILQGPSRRALEKILPAVLPTRRWFGGKAKTIQSVSIADVIPFHNGPHRLDVHLALLQVEYVGDEPEMYLLPLAFASGERAERIASESSRNLVARLRVGGDGETGLLYDAVEEEDFRQLLLETIAARRRWNGKSGKLAGKPSRAFRRLRGPSGEPLPSALLRGEQTNSSIAYGQRLLLKLFRRLEEGVNPDLEIGLFLTETAEFPHISPVAGAIEYRTGESEPSTVAILQEFVLNEGDAWRYTLDAVGRYFERVLTQPPADGQVDEALLGKPLLDLAATEIPPLAEDLCNGYLHSAELLGRRTAELHLALGSQADNASFAPEPISEHYQRSLYQGMRALARRVFRLLRGRLKELPAGLAREAEDLLSREGDVYERFRAIVGRKISAVRIRCHGDYHLGQVLFTGKDFVIIDFEGEPARRISERRIKRSPLRDVAGMLRSFHYASYSPLLGQLGHLVAIEADAPQFHRWARFWSVWTSAVFLKSYLATAAGVPFVPARREDVQLLLDVFLLEKAIYELGYELNNRPDWSRVPLIGIRQLLETAT